MKLNNKKKPSAIAGGFFVYHLNSCGMNSFRLLRQVSHS